MKKIPINKGDKYGSLTVIKEGERKITPNGQTNRTALCKCICGNIKTIRISHLTRGRIKSCGCANKTMNGKSNTKIGVLYRAMKYRCSENYFEKHLYYEKGIKVCDEWVKSFKLFETWCKNNGYEQGLQLDRIDNLKGYFPSNCRFVLPKINVNNRDNTLYVIYENEKISLNLLIDKLNIKNKYSTILSRIKRGWELKKALYKPPAKNYSGRQKK